MCEARGGEVIFPSGPSPSPLLIVGESPGAEDERLGSPFNGASGLELNRMLSEAGLNRNDCFMTNLCRVRPPGGEIENLIAQTKKDRTPAHILLRDKYVLPPILEGYNLLLREIELCKPKVIIALGNWALWSLTGKQGAKHWRGSQLFTDSNIPLIPTYSPTAVLRNWSWRAVVVNDLRRAAAILRDGAVIEPDYSFVIRPRFDEVITTLSMITDKLTLGETPISYDIETAGNHILCMGFAWSPIEAISIPFSTNAGTHHYWIEHEEAEIIYLLYKIMTHKNFRGIGQNSFFDDQYVFRHWHFVPRHHIDTMIAWHSCFSTLPKSLDFLASMLCKHYVNWKGISRELHTLKKDD